MTDADRPAPPRGFSTRAIKAATRAPRVDQHPNSVPIYQAVTFSADDAEELGAITTGERRPATPTRGSPTRPATALAAAIAELEGAEAAAVFSSGMAAIHAALLSVLAAGDRVVATRAIYGSTRALLDQPLRPAWRGRRRSSTPRTWRPSRRRSRRPRPGSCTSRRSRTRRSSSPTSPPWPSSPTATARCSSSTTRSPRRSCAARSSSARTSSIESLTKYLGGHSDTLGGSVAGSRDRIADVKAVEIDTGATLAPFAAFLVLRGLATLAIRMARHAATARALADWLEVAARASRGSATRTWPAIPSTRSRRGSSRTRSGMLAFELAGGPVGGAGRGRRVHRRAHDPGADGLARQHPHDRRPPADDHPSPVRRGAARGGRDPAGSAALLGRARGPRRPDRRLRARPRHRANRRGERPSTGARRRAAPTSRDSVAVGAG